MPLSKQHTIIGRIGSRYGVRGWVHLQSFTDPGINIQHYPNWHVILRGEALPCKLESIKPHKDQFVAKIDLIDSPESARRFANATIAIDSDHLAALEPGDYYWSQLIGLTVVTTSGVELGQVHELLETGSNDILVIKNPKRRHIPYTDDAVIAIDLASQTITVDWDPEF